ncbi:MAG: SdrD B-like domain-containing protein [Rhodopirellula sp. JB044]|uniref:SdrD B-like domain-containing protein n=1 Tax=Rhodopirellula sp. JB044 TaxID=3342844 RepID=UPI00370A0A7C
MPGVIWKHIENICSGLGIASSKRSRLREPSASSMHTRRGHLSKLIAASSQRPGVHSRNMRVESLEERRLMAADPIHVGVVYLETDYLETDVGSDSAGDKFILSFTGGAPGTKLTELRIITDKDGDGISVGDPIFDTEAGGRGKNGFHDFELVPGQSEVVEVEVVDGGQELILRPEDFQAGDQLVFTLDVDEVLRNLEDLEQFNQRLDVITSGQEFQDSILEAVFEAPNYYEASADSIFLNDYGDPKADFGLNLPPDESDDAESLPNRSAAAVASVTQTPRPASVGGFVYRDDNDSGTKDPGEVGLGGVLIRLEPIDTIAPQATLTTTTAADGSYQFNNVMPGTYRIVEVDQPEDLDDGKDAAGTISGRVVGSAVNPGDEIVGVVLNGGDAGVNYNFGELPLGSIGGFVFLAAPGADCDGDHDDGDSTPLPDVEIRLIDENGNVVETTYTAADGSYRFDDLHKGVYSIVEVTPEGLIDGGAHPGDIQTLASNVLVGIGSAVDGGTITHVELPSGGQGESYNFCEAAPGSISGQVYHDRDNDGVRDAGEEAIGDVSLDLVDASGTVVASTQTNSQGQYIFDDLPPGTYSVIETQPSGYIDGKDRVGTIGSAQSGRLGADNDSLVDIVLRQGLHGVNYDFGERQVASISGRVHVDLDEDCQLDPNETTLAGVVIELKDESGKTIATTQTDALGMYYFDNLLPGTYSVVEQQPAGYFEGGATVGSAGGVLDGTNRIEQVTLTSGENATDYDFCERPPADLSGVVYVDRDADCVRDANEEGLEGVLIELIDSSGNVVASTTTDSNGQYRFTNLRAGDYLVRETQPDGYFHGGQTAGSHGGDDSVTDRISAIPVGWGETLTNYNFCEVLPAEISGIVYVDRDNDCVRDSGEEGLAGVLIELIDSSGNVVDSTTTDANGNYSFTNLEAGEYVVRETQPEGYFHGGQTAGSKGGDDSVADRISAIPVGWGETLTNYNFCEVLPSEISGVVYVDRDEDCFRDSNEEGLAGVLIELLDSSGTVIATTTTNSLGEYSFTNLRAGEYQIRETQPAGYFHGGQVAGSKGGDDSVADRISAIPVGWGESLVNYDFCELLPSEISGVVYVDTDRDCFQDPDEIGLGGVRVELYNDADQLIAFTLTANDGSYSFTNLEKGNYTVREIQPEGYFHGGQVAGSGGGDDSVDDVISQIALASGQSLTRYDFCELPPATISGKVWSNLDLDQEFDENESPIPGVVIELRDESGNVIATTQTDADGCYEFTGLRPGRYQVKEYQPEGYFHGGQTIGTLGGRLLQFDLIGEIDVEGGEHGTQYNFPEVPPVTISGYVFQDGDALVLSETPDPADLRDYRDGQLTSDDVRLGGVTLELRDVFGVAIDPAIDQLGNSSSDVIRVTTDENGYYEFTGLRPRIVYSVYQTQPTGYVDSLDTAGTTGGLAINAADFPDVGALDTFISRLAEGGDPKFDAIFNIQVDPGQTSTSNNFSEIVIEEPPVVPPPADEDPAPEAPITPIETFDPVVPVEAYWQPQNITRPMLADDEWEVSWHLSVINGGFPRGQGTESAMMALSDGRLQIQQATYRGADDANGAAVGKLPDVLLEVNLSKGRWQITPSSANTMQALSANTQSLSAENSDDSIRLGHEDATALTGDFDGDGVDEAVLFINGQWFVDLNGDGQWDAGDLWVRLGTELDRPVVGDWDGDGKDDVGIFGRRWQNDAERIRQDPGLPDPANHRRRQLRREDLVHRELTEEEKQQRLLLRGEDGQWLADAVDHVFQYGEQVDTPIAGDWNGDGIDQIGVFRSGQWMLDEDGDGRWTSKDRPKTFGRPGDEPIVGDFNGDGIDEIGVVRGDLWIIDTDGDRRITGNDKQIRVPRPSGDSQPIAGDFDGDDIDDPGYYQAAG